MEDVTAIRKIPDQFWIYVERSIQADGLFADMIAQQQAKARIRKRVARKAVVRNPGLYSVSWIALALGLGDGGSAF